MSNTKQCLRCNAEKELTEFNKDSKKPDGLAIYCRDCANGMVRNHYHRNADTERQRGRKKDSSIEARARRLVRSAQLRATERGLPCTVTAEWVLERLRGGVCEATGIQFDIRDGGGRNLRRSFCPSLDRIDPAQGYTPENTAVVCWIYNAAKGTAGHEDVMIMVEALWHRK